MKTKDARSKLDRLVGQRDSLAGQVDRLSLDLQNTNDNLQAAKEAQVIIQSVAKAVQQEAHERIASVVCRCLEAVFDDPYEFEISFESKRGRTEAVLEFVRQDTRMDPLSAAGGGVVDVAAFALRLACLVLAKPRNRRVLFLDEPFRFVSENFRSRIRDLLLTISEEMGVQIVMVTHIDELRIGKIVEL